jgi:hypothetical protein
MVKLMVMSVAAKNNRTIVTVMRVQRLCVALVDKSYVYMQLICTFNGKNMFAVRRT